MLMFIFYYDFMIILNLPFRGEMKSTLRWKLQLSYGMHGADIIFGKHKLPKGIDADFE